MPSRRRTGPAAILALSFVLSPAACATAAADDGDFGPDTKQSETVPTPASTAGANGSCATSAECPAAPPCEEAACIDRKCVQRPIECAGGSECAPNACDPATSACVTTPAPDRTKCDNGFGQCVSGQCEALTSCFGDTPMQYIHCYGLTARDLSTGLYEGSRVSTYACASGQVATEVALELSDAPANANVKVTLSVTDASDADLDLIVLEGDCTGAAACAGQSLTAGTGTESATFTAKANKTYYVVVDGKVTTPTKFHVAVECTP
jgi:hypothetical protein